MALDDRIVQTMLDRLGGVPISLNGTTVKGIFRTHDADLLNGEASIYPGRVRSFKLKTGSLVGLVPDAIVQVAGTRFRVLSTRLLDDGALTELMLAEVET